MNTCLINVFAVAFLSLVAAFTAPPDALAARCLYVSSYHSGYEWNDGIERGIESVLAGKCTLDKFYMDTHKNKNDDFGRKAGLAAKAHIERTRPDVVIAGDDSASKFLVMPYYKNAALPFVFCGINGTVEPYGYPYSNATGMIEISPIKPLKKQLADVLGRVKQGIYLGPDIISQRKEFELNERIYAADGIAIMPILVKNMDEWVAGYKEAQRADFIIIGNNGGILDWDDRRAWQTAFDHARKLTVTNYDWMVNFAMFSMTKIPEEQGEWAAKVALRTLAGESPASIPIVPNQRTNIFMNPRLLEKAGITLSRQITQKAIKVDAKQ